MIASQPERILIGVAWPYANGPQHIGHIAGAYLPADIFARYQRLRGNRVLMVSGSDSHGTPITIRAEAEGVAPMEVVERFHRGFIASYQKLGLSFDLFTHTDTDCHWRAAQALFERLHQGGFLYEEDQVQLFDPVAQKFLPDRYVEGICPVCGSDGARGDQCDHCGSTYEATALREPRSRLTGATNLERRTSRHFLFDLSKLNEALLAWVGQGKEHWRPAVLNHVRSELGRRDLRGRPITRDIDWGIRVPLEGWKSKTLYVWFEAVIGYLSATKEWASLTGDAQAWHAFWDADAQPATRSVYFLGKDNIPFHAILWPAMLLAHGGLALPSDIAANQYLNVAGQKFSKSRGRMIAIDDVLERYQSDAWRYALAALAPETSDVDFTWEEFVARVNNELVAAWGNLANRVLGFTSRSFSGTVPSPGALGETDRVLLETVRSGFTTVGALYDQIKLRAAVDATHALCKQVNQYLSDAAPWTAIKTDRARAETTVYVALQCIDWLKILWAPVLPESCQKLHTMLGHDGSLFGRQYTETVRDERGEHLVLRYDATGASGRWEPAGLAPGQRMGEPQPLFTKLDPEAVLAAEAPEGP